MKIKLVHRYENIISVENILEAWQEFLRGKRNKPDVQEFSLHLMDNIFDLYYDLANYTYKHGGYQQFKINDPKPRIIHKATVRDRLLHHAVYRTLYPFFDKTFISDSFSCRDGKGTHKALNKFREYIRIVSKNNTNPCWVLKCDIKKFFASIDQQMLIKILEKHIPDKNIISLLKEIIFSFKPNGLPLGNLTSQVFANVYLSELDYFMKHKLKAKYYIRYADDFVVLSNDKIYPKFLLPKISSYLENNLKLKLHPNKIFIKTIYSGMDFLGWINFSDHRILRTATRKRMIRRLEANSGPETFNSYLGLLSHGNTEKVRISVLKFDTGSWQSIIKKKNKSP